MVIGNGMIANEFKEYRENDEIIIFASGVSDSIHPSASAFQREKNLLTETIRNNASRQIVYFSTCSMYDPSMKDSAYARHKLNMEELIQLHNSFTIFRLSNAVGKTNNKTTVVNYFIEHILERKQFDAWKNASRNIIDIDDMYAVCNEVLKRKASNAIINIANPHNYPVPFIIETIENHFGRKGKYRMVDKGDGPQIDIAYVEPFFRQLNLNFGPDYFPQLLQKYFPPQ